MTRFAFYTDLHLSGQTPRHRIDDYPQTLIKKLEEVYIRAEEENCDFVIFGGDLFHTHRIYSYKVISDAMDVICDSKLKTYSIIGQHDLKGYNKNTFDTSALAFLIRRCGNFNIVWEPTEVGDTWLVPSHVWDDLDKAGDEAARSDKFNILIAHHLITNKKAMFDVVNTTDFVNGCHAGCPYQLVLSGDLHDGYEPHKVEDTWFCNPGSMARRATSDGHRMPQFAIIDVDGPRDEPVIRLERLNCAKVAEEIFSEDIVELVRKRDDFDAEDLVEGMQAFEVDAEDVHDLIQTVGRTEKVEKSILDYLATKNREKIS